MNPILILLLTLMGIAILSLAAKLFLMKKSAGEIEEQLYEKLHTDTNTLIGIASSDRTMKRLAASLNEELQFLRKERIRFEQGDRDLKEAVTNISHDLRTPLTAITGYLELLEKEDDPGAVRCYLDILSERVAVLWELTDELLKYSVAVSAERELPMKVLVVNHVLEESISAFYATLHERGITPRIHLCDKKVLRLLNKNALLRIFSNILSNAAKYSDGDLEILLTEAGEVVFSNHSSQLDEVGTARLFDRFYTVETAEPSTGLGLSIARTLTERMGGRISASYRDGTLVITLVFPVL